MVLPCAIHLETDLRSSCLYLLHPVGGVCRDKPCGLPRWTFLILKVAASLEIVKMGCKKRTLWDFGWSSCQHES